MRGLKGAQRKADTALRRLENAADDGECRSASAAHWRRLAYLLSALLFHAVAQAVDLPAGTSPGSTTLAAQTLSDELKSNRHPGITGFAYALGDRAPILMATTEVNKSGADIRSATKSITALLIGIAIDRGLLPSVEVKIIDYLPEVRDLLLADPRKGQITVQDLLSMRSGLDCNDWNRDSPGHEDTMYKKRDWLRFWAGQRMHDVPGSAFSYCTGNAIALGRILKHVTGMDADAFAQQALFAPLEIAQPDWQRWNRGADVDTGGHLRLRPGDLLKIGQLLLKRGSSGEHRVVSGEWIEQMTMPRAEINGMQQRYGYFWWIDATHMPGLTSTRLWMAWGNGGNYIVVMPELDAVATFTGTRFNKDDATEPLLWLRDRLLPGLRAAAPKRD